MLGFLESPKAKKNNYYETLSFKTKREANKNRKEIETYFDKRILDISIEKGTDEKGNKGFIVCYTLI